MDRFLPLILPRRVDRVRRRVNRGLYKDQLRPLLYGETLMEICYIHKRRPPPALLPAINTSASTYAAYVAYMTVSTRDTLRTPSTYQTHRKHVQSMIQYICIMHRRPFALSICRANSDRKP